MALQCVHPVRDARPVQRSAEPVLALLAMQGTPLGVGLCPCEACEACPLVGRGWPSNPCEACEACKAREAYGMYGLLLRQPQQAGGDCPLKPNRG